MKTQKPVRQLASVSLLFLALSLIGCSEPAPTKADALVVFKQATRWASLLGDKTIKINSFKISGGGTQKISGLTLYKMDFAAEIEYLKDYAPAADCNGSDCRSYKAGEMREITGVICFQMTATGWEGQGLDCS